MGYTIRPAGLSDLPRLAELWKGLVTDPSASDLSIPPSEENVAAWTAFAAEVIKRDPSQVLVAVSEEGEVVGYILYVKRPASAIKRRPMCAVIYDLYVVPEHRRRGVGSALLERALSIMREGGMECVELSVWVGNEEARRLYRKFGFEEYIVQMRRVLKAEPARAS